MRHFEETLYKSIPRHNSDILEMNDFEKEDDKDSLPNFYNEEHSLSIAESYAAQKTPSPPKIKTRKRMIEALTNILDNSSPCSMKKWQSMMFQQEEEVLSRRKGMDKVIAEAMQGGCVLPPAVDQNRKSNKRSMSVAETAAKKNQRKAKQNNNIR